jgi:hypothetical protein
MPDQKVSQLQGLTSPASEDLFLIIDNPNGTPVSKNITVKVLFGNIPANTSISGLFTANANTNFLGANNVFSYNVKVNGTMDTNGFKVSSNGFVVSNSLTPANSSVSGIPTGKWFYDANYIYIKTANTTIKRVALESF